MQQCFFCKRSLPSNFIFQSAGEPLPENAWHMKNIAPHAASGGSMVPVCKKCDPDPLGMIAAARDALNRIEARKGEDVDEWAQRLGNDLGQFAD